MYEHVFQCSVKLLRVCFFVGVVQLCCVLSQVLLLVTIDAQVTLLPEVFNLLLSNLTNEIAYKIEDQIYKCHFNQVHTFFYDGCVCMLCVVRGCPV